MALYELYVLYWYMVYALRYMVKGSVDQRRRRQRRISGHINQINEIEDSYGLKREELGVGAGARRGRGRVRESFRRSADDFCGWPNVFIVTFFGYHKAKQKRKLKNRWRSRTKRKQLKERKDVGSESNISSIKS